MDPLSAAPGRKIVRKHAGPVPTDTIDVASVARVDVTSEQELYPIDHLFDGRNGPGGSCWIASAPGPQVVVLRFDHPLETLCTVVVESEERGETRTQRVEIAGWSSGSVREFEGDARVFEYSPYGPSFHRASWNVGERSITHLSFRVSPAPGRRLASLTAIILCSEVR